MDTSRVIALSNLYREAADKVLESQNRIKGTVDWNGADWKGERREQFNREYEETVEAFHRYARDLMATSEELQKVAVKMEEMKKELAKQANPKAEIRV
ncbi:WXG100 family type VII secretion target [Aneurinibacillus tyrosinisolvens]|uniref:WXG100 family type VII secretion target n=1 Tax=Aneurinibacillus tyrosinisolvens TaxID=1443435 RepID=UPI00063F352D|nr:WXG100 family type VII secretion target [Aneurinibacillus tyrosinisolvens]